jgi:S-adenosylmethionine decarboxylase
MGQNNLNEERSDWMSGRHHCWNLECNMAVLDDLEYLENALVSAAKEAGATVLDKSFHQFAPQGVSGVVLIAESHLSLHTWPEHAYAAVDIFTCGTTVKIEVAADALIRQLGSKDPSVLEVKRGMFVRERKLVG